MRLISLLFFLFIGSHFAFAQFQIEGLIQDEQQANIAFANVILLSNEAEFVKGEVADAEGQFYLKNVAAGDYKLTVSAIGFADYEQVISLSADLNLNSISLTTNLVELADVVVTAQKVAYERRADRTVVNVGSLPTAAGGNALELLAKSPSVQLDQMNGNISLLGRADVVVFINEKRARLQGTDLMQYLSSIPAANIELLELINNPPASYDADGTGGIINIVIKNYEADGITGNASIFGGYGERGKYGGTATINYKMGKLNLYADGSTTQDYTFQNSEIKTSIPFTDGLLATDQRSIRPAYLGNYNGKIGLGYVLSPNTTIDIFGAYARRRWALAAETNTDYEGDLSSINNDFLTANETNTYQQYHLSTHLQQRLKNGHSLSADYDYLYFNMVNPASYQLQNFAANGELDSQSNFSTNKETPFDFHVARLDYKGKVGEQINFETGVKMSLANVQNRTAFFDKNGATVAENIFTDQVDLAEQIYAAYLSVDGNLGDKFSFVGGLRYEYSDLALTAERNDVNRQLGRLFPSLSITRNFTDVSRLTLAYRERISRPSFQFLVPSFFFINPYTVLTGNVQVLPNINRTVEATLNHQSLFVSLSYATDDNPLASTLVFDQESYLLLLVTDNVDHRQQVGLNVGFPIKFTKFWGSNYNFGNFWRSDQTIFAEANIIESHPFFTVDVNQNFQLPKDWSLELSGKWASKSYHGNMYVRAQTTLNFGVQKKFKNGTLGLSWTDIFNSGSFFGLVSDLAEQQVFFDWNYDFEGSIVRLSYTHKFGGKQVKQSRNSGATDVLQRVN
ncbi:MAG: outer membrane beta-barrel protein [Saprospiraceae bacterium]